MQYIQLKSLSFIQIKHLFFNGEINHISFDKKGFFLFTSFSYVSNAIWNGIETELRYPENKNQ